jgi:hypothetical protein
MGFHITVPDHQASAYSTLVRSIWIASSVETISGLVSMIVTVFRIWHSNPDLGSRVLVSLHSKRVHFAQIIGDALRRANRPNLQLLFVFHQDLDDVREKPPVHRSEDQVHCQHRRGILRFPSPKLAPNGGVSKRLPEETPSAKPGQANPRRRGSHAKNGRSDRCFASHLDSSSPPPITGRVEWTRISSLL